MTPLYHHKIPCRLRPNVPTRDLTIEIISHTSGDIQGVAAPDRLAVVAFRLWCFGSLNCGSTGEHRECKVACIDLMVAHGG